jgi:hypothetical protein
VKRECLHGRGELSEHDRAELEKFEDFLWEVKAGKSQADAYRDVYGETVFDAAAHGQEKG